MSTTSLPPSLVNYKLSRSPLRRPASSALCIVSSLALLLFIAIATGTPFAYAKGPETLQRIPLGPLGFQAISSHHLLEGATMLTVDYADSQHLLVTFGISKLLPRLPDCPADDEDRVVKAVLLEIPSGKELAYTEWRFHDYAQYLWDLGGGHFLLRQRDVLTTISPLQNLSAGGAFLEEPFLRFDRRIEAIAVSANHDLLTIETVKRKPPAPVDPLVQTGASPQAAASANIHNPVLRHRDPVEANIDPAPVETVFIRLEHNAVDSEAPFSRDSSTEQHGRPLAGTAADQPSRLLARIERRIHTAKPANFPITNEGLLEFKTASSDDFQLDFLTFTGRVINLGEFPSSCPLRPAFVSPSEFVAFGCRGSDDSVELAGFNLHGTFIWQMNFTDPQAYASIVSAVPAGRFAFSSTSTVMNIVGTSPPAASELTGQEVRVIQMYNGKQLLRVSTSPIQLPGQNFALSPDGMALAIVRDNVVTRGEQAVHNGTVEIYKLPALSAKDNAELKAEAALAPEPANAHIRFSVEEIKAALAEQPGISPINPSLAIQPALAEPTPAAATPAASEKAEPKVAPAKTQPPDPEPVALGDPQTRRKPPTLYEPAPASSGPPPQ